MKKIIFYQLMVIFSTFLVVLSTPPTDLFYLVWFSFIPILIILEKSSTKEAIWYGLELGLFINMYAFYWLKDTIEIFGGIHYTLSIVLYLGLCVVQGARFPILFYIYKKFKLNDKNFFIFPLLYTVLEYFIPMLFNWTIGNTQYKFLPFIQITDIFGISILSLVMLIFNYAVYKIIYKYRNEKILQLKPLLYVLLLLSIILIYGLVQIKRFDNIMAESEKIRIGVVQASIPINEHKDYRKFKKNHSIFLEESLKLEKDNIDLIVWPESSHYKSENYHVKSLPYVLGGLKTSLIFGGVSYGKEKGKRGYYNTAFFLDENAKVLDRYNKHYLLAFGEYVPFRKHLSFLEKYFVNVGNFHKGEEVKVFNFKNKAKIGVMICYEDIIEAFSNRINDKNPNLLVNLTNDAWFGKTSAADLHKMIAIYRTLENRLFLVRATNTGRTTVIDANGREIKSLPLFETSNMYEDVSIMNIRTLYQRFGYLTPYFMVFILFLLLFLEHRKRNRNV